MGEADVCNQRLFVGSFLTGLAVVTAADGGDDYGSTVSSVMSVSLLPPLLLVSLVHDSATLTAVRRSGIFCVTLLADGSDGRWAAKVFSRPGPKRWDLVRHERSPSGLIVVSDCVAAAEFIAVDEYAVADHVLIFGAPQWHRFVDDATPLRYWRSQY